MKREDMKKFGYNKRINDLLNTNEINRIHRAAKNKDKKEIKKWAKEYDQYVNDKYYEIYRKEYENWLYQTFKDMDLAICYTLHFSETTKFGMKRITSFMNDIAIIMRGFYNMEFSREEYNEMLKNDNINVLGDWDE